MSPKPENAESSSDGSVVPRYYSWSGYALYSTVNGINLAFQVTKKKRSMINMELILFAFTLFVSLALTTKAFVVYLSYPIETKVYNLVSQESTVFPAITVCPSIMMKKSGVGQFTKLLDVLHSYYSGSMRNEKFYEKVNNRFSLYALINFRTIS